MFTCFLTRRRIGAYLDGALGEGQSRSTAAHLGTCAVCQGEADALRRLRAMLHRTLTPAEPDWTGFWQGVVRGIEASRREAPVRAQPGWLQPKWALSGVLAAALLVSVTFWQINPWQLTKRHTGPEGRVLVTSADSEDPRATVMVYSTPEQDVAVVWVFGLE